MSGLVPVTFRFPSRLVPAAQCVAITGTFNGWDPGTHRLRRDLHGDWTITVYLPPGRIVYCYSVDGTPWLDPADQGRIPNGWGSEYSVRYVGERADARLLTAATSRRCRAGRVSPGPCAPTFRAAPTRRRRPWRLYAPPPLRPAAGLGRRGAGAGLWQSRPWPS